MPHELFHVVQAAADADAEPWWSEGSAQWAAKSANPELTDLEKFLPSYFNDPGRPLDAPASGAASAFLYATAIWPVYLDSQFGKAVIVDIFDEMKQAPGASTDSMDTVLGAQGSSLGQEFATFAVWNTATGARAPEGVGYPDAAKYPQVKPEAIDTALLPATVSDLTASLSVHYYLLDEGPNRRVDIQTDSARNSALLVPLVGGKAMIGDASPLPADTAGAAIVVVAGTTPQKSDAPYTLTVSLAPETSDGGVGGSAGSGGGSGASSDPGDSGGCGCRTSGQRSHVVWSLLLVAVVLARRPQKRASRSRCW